MNIIEILFIAIGLSMDTFSLSIAISLTNMFKRNILLSSIVAIFHIIMPVLGHTLSMIIYQYININYNLLLGLILLIIGFSLIIEKENKNILIKDQLLSMLLFSLTVSIDAFSVGIGLNKLSFISLLIFGIISYIFTYTGLKFGDLFKNKYVKDPKKIGIIILIIMGVYNLIK
ncbi:MAG: manganese efflux pump [Bacilli bacterium]|nr:manganese efflux pump [Bacilli bacterium]